MSVAAILTIFKDGKEIKSQTLEDEVLIGRAEDCGIRLEDRAISRQHAAFKVVGENVQLEKRSDFAPVLVNGTDATSAIVKEGDVIEIGPYLVELKKKKSKSDRVEENIVSSIPKNEDVPLAPVVSLEDLKSITNLQSEPPVEATGLFEPEAGFNPLASAEEKIGEPPTASAPLDAAPDVSSIDQDVVLASEKPNDVLPPPVEEIQAFNLEENSKEIGTETGPIELPAFDLEGTKTRVVAEGIIEARVSFFQPDAATPSELILSKPETAIGRGSECDIILNDKKSSRKHVVIEKTGAQYILKDQGSANGVLVNGQQVSEHVLSSGDLIQIGDTEFKFEAINREFEEKKNELPSIPPIEEIQENTKVPPFQSPMAFGGLGTQAQIPSPGAIPGIDPLGLPTKEIKKKQTFFQKIESLPPRRRIVYILTILTALYLAFFDEDPKKPAPKKPGISKSSDPTSRALTFEMLPASKKRFVEAEHQLAFDYYKNREYDKALFELEKIFALIPDYKDSREIERYAKDGKRKLEAIEEERRRKEEESKLKARITHLIDETRQYMQKKQYAKAKALFSEILALDPDHPIVKGWQRDIDEFEELLRQQAQRKSIEKEINANAQKIYKTGLSEYRRGKYLTSIGTFKKVLDIQVSDLRIHSRARNMIASAGRRMDELREPLLQQAKELETTGSYVKAYELYKRASKVDPRHKEGQQGMDRIRGILHDRAKILYTEGVLSESYSDFNTARSKFEETMKTAPTDDIYFQRAKHKLSLYFHLPSDRAPATESAPAGDAPPSFGESRGGFEE